MDIFNTSAHGTLYASYLLTHDDLASFLKLQQDSIDVLPAHKKHYLKPRTQENLKNHLDAGMAIIGIKDNYGKHIAHMLLTDPKSPATLNLASHDIPKNSLVIQSLVIHPDYRPKQYAHIEETTKPHDLMFEQATTLAKKNNFESITAKISSKNLGSVSLFEEQNFSTSLPATSGTEDYKSVFCTYALKPNIIENKAKALAPTPQIPLSCAIA
jgi:hypothetical protein